MTEQKNWHSLALGDVFSQLKTKQDGLGDSEVLSRLEKFGPNEIILKQRHSNWRIFFHQFISPLIFLLVIAGIITIFLQEYLDTIVIFGAVFFNAAIGFFQERKALKSLKSLRQKQEFFTIAKRNGNWHKISAKEIVPGDIILLKPGDRVPADARIVTVFDLKINEAILTGEFLPVIKKIGITQKETNLADRINMVWMGTEVADGKATAVVTETARRTEFGKISTLLETIVKRKTPFEKRVAKLGRFLSALIIGLTAILVFIGISTGKTFGEMFLVAVAVAVSAIPEGLPIAVTVILAIGMTRILSKKGLVKELSSAETLGSTSVILTDKTGTLTLGQMRVSDVLIMDRDKNLAGLDNKKPEGNFLLTLKVAALTSEAIVENPHEEDISSLRVRGRPTDKAMLISAIEAGLNPEVLNKEYKIIDELPFSSVRKFLASVRKDQRGGTTIFFAGAPEVLFSYLKRTQINEKTYNISSDNLTDLKNTVNRLANKGLRLILLGYKKLDKNYVSEEITDRKKQKWFDLLEGSTFLGLMAIKDPVRKDVAEMITLNRKAGIKTVIVTGDHALTARSVGKEIGLLGKGRTLFNIMEGTELEKIDVKELTRRVRTIDIFARVSPEHKVKIVDAWQEQGEVVAMGGDGVNDAPALRKADVGIAVGTGTDITKEAADVILLDNNFSTIVAAVKEGRVILDNLKKVITYLLADSFTEILLVSSALIIGLPLPILPAQILWVNLIEDSFPSIALAFDPAEKDIMTLPPSSSKKPLLDKEMKVLTAIISVLTFSILLVLFFIFLSQSDNLDYVRTIVFVGLAINSLFFAFALRSLRRPIWQINFFGNKHLIAAVLFGFFLIILSVYFLPLQTVLRTVPLGGLEWIILIGFGILNIIAIEVGKWFFIHKKMSKI